MSIPLVLCLATLALLLATAASGLAIAVLERRGVVPRLAELAFFGLGAAGSVVLVASVAIMHPITADRLGLRDAYVSIATVAMASEETAEANGDSVLRRVSLTEPAAYDRGQVRPYGRGAEGESGHEILVFRSFGAR
ncbi:MAG: hypothetical protein NXI18_11550 [Alphaproteobacteria bacterium]|nr:hypothetical protein [Alphaproteobacteria bacterium]